MSARGVLAYAAPLFILSFAFANVARAQLEFPGLDNALTITTSPQYPGPDQTVELSVDSPLFDLSQANITWSAGGTTIAQGMGETSASITTGAIGSQTIVSVSADTSAGEASAQITLTPAQVDLLVDSDAYTPPFYRGRALPSPGSTLVVEAIPRLPGSDLSYTWSVNGQTDASVSGAGKSTAALPAPPLYGSETIAVVVAPEGGGAGASASMAIASVDPSPTLYEDNPLYGIEYYDALGEQTSINDTEMTFAAVPYFATALAADDPLLEYDWTVNGQSVGSATSSNEITVDASQVQDEAQIGLTVRHATNYLLDGTGSWLVSFSQTGAFQEPSAGPSQNVFDTGESQ